MSTTPAMTLQQLADAIMALPDADRQQPAVVWPPPMCPAHERVAITEVRKQTVTTDVVTILTGKEPV